MAEVEEKKEKNADVCDHDCSHCGAECASRNEEPDPAAEARKEINKIKKVYAVMSGKGGVGKSLVTAVLASAAAALGKTVAVLDADITGPSVPRAFGLKTRAGGSPLGISEGAAYDKGIEHSLGPFQRNRLAPARRAQAARPGNHLPGPVYAQTAPPVPETLPCPPPAGGI